MQITRRTKLAGQTLVEVVVSLSMGCLVFAGVLMGYVQTSDRAEWSSYSLAAQSLAFQAVEQARGGKWDPSAWPPVDEMQPTNYVSVEMLDVPVAGNPILATNYVTIRDVSLAPPLREMRADCVWAMPGRDAARRGPFTNTAVTLRSRDQ